MTTASSLTRCIRIGSTEIPAGFVPVALATVDSPGVYADCPDIPVPEVAEDVPILLSPERTEPATYDEEGKELTPAVLIPAQYDVRRVVLTPATVIPGSNEEQRICAAWLATLPPLPVVEVVPTYTRQDYANAIDNMLQAECSAHEGYTFESIIAASSYAARPSGYFYLAGCWFADLRDFVWATAGQMAKQPPSENPPTPDQLAAYLLATFTASNPFPQ